MIQFLLGFYLGGAFLEGVLTAAVGQYAGGCVEEADGQPPAETLGWLHRLERCIQSVWSVALRSMVWPYSVYRAIRSSLKTSK